MSSLPQRSEVRVPKAAEIVAAKLRRAIVGGTIKSGGNLPSEAKLIEMFDVSRPTLREAIRILEFENLISVSRGARGGAVVLSPSPAFVSRAMGVALQATGATLGDIYAARLEIEPLAAKMAAETRPKAAAETLRAHIASERELLSTSNQIAGATAEFHKLLMEQCGNKTFALMGVALHGVVSKHQALFHRVRLPEAAETTRKRSNIGVLSQEKLVGLIEAGEGDKAQAHWRTHMEKAGEFFLPGMAHTSVVDVLDDEKWG